MMRNWASRHISGRGCQVDRQRGNRDSIYVAVVGPLSRQGSWGSQEQCCPSGIHFGCAFGLIASKIFSAYMWGRCRSILTVQQLLPAWKSRSDAVENSGRVAACSTGSGQRDHAGFAVMGMLMARNISLQKLFQASPVRRWSHHT